MKKEIIKCKDCKYWIQKDNTVNVGCCTKARDILDEIIEGGEIAEKKRRDILSEITGCGEIVEKKIENILDNFMVVKSGKDFTCLFVTKK